MSIGNGEKDLFRVGFVVDIKDGSALDVAGKDSALELDFSDEMTWIAIIKEVDDETLAKNLREAGANEDLAATVEEGIAYFKSIADYY